MAANIHPETGIAYGVVAADKVPNLRERFFENGTDNRYESAKAELTNRLLGAEDVEQVNSIIDEFDKDQRVDDMEFDVADLVLELLADFDDDSDFCNRTLKEDGYHYEMTSMGGALTIYVIESPYVAYCRPCSPCCPNAGDLNNIGDSGMTAYCFDPDDYGADWWDEKDKLKFIVDKSVTPHCISLPDEDDDELDFDYDNEEQQRRDKVETIDDADTN